MNIRTFLDTHCENTVGINIFDDCVELEILISEKEADYLYSRHKRSGHIRSPITSYDIGIRYIETYEYDHNESNELNELCITQFPILKSLQIELYNNTDLFWSWVLSFHDLSVLITHKILPSIIYKQLLCNNQLRVLMSVIDENISDILQKHDLSYCDITLAWIGAISPSVLVGDHYLNIAKISKPKTIRLYSLEHIDGTYVNIDERTNDEPTDYDFGVHERFIFHNSKLACLLEQLGYTSCFETVILSSGSSIRRCPLQHELYDNFREIFMQDGEYYEEDDNNEKNEYCSNEWHPHRDGYKYAL